MSYQERQKLLDDQPSLSRLPNAARLPGDVIPLKNFLAPFTGEVKPPAPGDGIVTHNGPSGNRRVAPILPLPGRRPEVAGAFPLTERPVPRVLFGLTGPGCRCVLLRKQQVIANAGAVAASPAHGAVAV